ncbi:MAG: GatB/YqeY domain-containing protein [Candidatus Saccharibacteria bacterium]
MSLKQTIQDDFKAALLSGDRFRGEVLNAIKSAVLYEEIASKKREAGLSDAEIENVIAREVKKRKESASIYLENNRKEAADQELKEAAIMEEYLPEKISEAELIKKIDDKIKELEVSDIKGMGKVIGALKSELGSAVDGKLLSDKVKEKLTN